MHQVLAWLEPLLLCAMFDVLLQEVSMQADTLSKLHTIGERYGAKVHYTNHPAYM